MSGDDVVKVKYRMGNVKVNRYLYISSDFKQFSKIIQDNAPLQLTQLYMYWIDGEKDLISIRNKEDFSIFMQLSSGLKIRHIFVSTQPNMIE